MRHQPDGASPVQSVDRALQVLEVLARRGTAGVSDIAGELGVHKSTASRLLSTLEGRGFVEQLSERGTYRLGFALLRLAGAGAAQLDVAVRGRAVCERLSAELDEAVGLAVLDGAAAVNVSQVHGSASVGVRNWVGRRTPLHATSSGKVLLAHAPEAVQDAVLAGVLERYTEATVTDPGTLRRQLEEVVARGWGVSVEELEVGLNAVAAPVRDADGQVTAAVSVSGPSFRMTPGSLGDLVAPLVVEAADALSRRLGFFG
jgi:DNA-binding IclR family transcriptional regulator